MQPYERELLQFFSKIGQAPASEYRDLYRQLKTRLFPAAADSLVPPDALRMLDLGKWLADK